MTKPTLKEMIDEHNFRIKYRKTFVKVYLGGILTGALITISLIILL